MFSFLTTIATTPCDITSCEQNLSAIKMYTRKLKAQTRRAQNKQS